MGHPWCVQHLFDATISISWVFFEIFFDCFAAFFPYKKSKWIVFFIILKMDENSKMIDIITNSVIAVLTFIFIFIACEPGERVSEAFEQLNDELIQCDWHLLPTEIQRLYLIFLVNTQQSINFQCYGGILCTRDTSKNVITLQRMADLDKIHKSYSILNKEQSLNWNLNSSFILF